MKKIINLSEAEVLKSFQSLRNYSLLENKIMFSHVKCLQDYVLTFENDRKLFSKGETYTLWIAQLQNLKTGGLFYATAAPKIEDNFASCYVVPKEIFGHLQFEVKETSIDIAGQTYKLVLSPNGKQLLIPSWHLDKEAVEAFFAKITKVQPIKYMLVPRLFGKKMSDVFPAWEIHKIFENREEAYYFNVFNGKINGDFSKQRIFISIGNNQKMTMFGDLKIAYRKKKMHISLK